MIQSISIVGAGKVATHLSKRLRASGLNIRQIYSRQLEDAQELAATLNAEGINQWKDLQFSELDLLIIAVNDQAIPEVAQILSTLLSHSTLVVHTSGSSPLSWLNALPRCGIFYPLQSFSPGREPDFQQIPICVEAPAQSDQNLLIELGQRISQKVQVTSEADRRSLHLAAVFVNNFVNHLYQIAAEILAERHLPFDLLLPLIQETAAKIQGHNPAEMQTGPALRGDRATIERHLDMLEDHPEWRELYGVFTALIRS
ncbi:MAG: Rossmann-like and DUF2520 domain-containing protein [Haliscomenobacter sp.]|uniref:Rossmann-like and DUF2520 domain-containing protein n=1 Tax=Haliscomenobacter sp. TaxID=2717303 RepID=UPI0029A00CF6|nr:Rossmann-like and DUF2520 domain-containing protein [Haliscomenobacter sp.]MDX2070960.1 Rossmann-like and DUF2520 domain-containing protein [Haliscomenobacter sp.]